jgi:hypothetical protein
MPVPSSQTPQTVNRSGAGADTVLCGSGRNNQGLRLRALQAQPRGTDGPIQGRFIILDAGDNRHSEALAPLLNRVTHAQEVLDLLRKEHPACVNVVNLNILVAEAAPDRAGGATTEPGF